MWKGTKYLTYLDEIWWKWWRTSTTSWSLCQSEDQMITFGLIDEMCSWKNAVRKGRDNEMWFAASYVTVRLLYCTSSLIIVDLLSTFGINKRKICKKVRNIWHIWMKSGATGGGILLFHDRYSSLKIKWLLFDTSTKCVH